MLQFPGTVCGRCSPALDFELARFISTGRNPKKRAVATAFREDVERLGDSPFVADIDPWVAGTRTTRG
jgi:enoyl-CoA hydratase